MERSTTNILLLKDDVGRGRGSTHKLPENDHSYGVPNQRDKVGASVCKFYLSLFILQSDLVLADAQHSAEEDNGQRLHETEQNSH